MRDPQAPTPSPVYHVIRNQGVLVVPFSNGKPHHLSWYPLCGTAICGRNGNEAFICPEPVELGHTPESDGPKRCSTSRREVESKGG